ncbi:hypothetical protein SBRCBS47491_000615 [Sporothrix bragantina]|uniref:Alcohol dehydrogenase n=1 Tax=Sporothrix bragantina TaxID=671064 RepID=A0ABP0ARS4_9PEZI
MAADNGAGGPPSCPPIPSVSPATAVTPATPITPASPGLLPVPASPPPQDIASLLTIILTTSPTPSAPATDLVSAVIASFRAHCPALLACPVIVVFDTYDHVGPQLRLKKGWVTPVEAANYDAYKANIKALVKDTWAGDDATDAEPVHAEEGTAEYGSPFIADNSVPFTMTRTAGGRVAFVEPAMRLGFGLGVRTAVRAATTPYVWVQQHDWTLAADIPLAAMLDAMRTAEQAVGEEGSDDEVVEGETEESMADLDPSTDASTAASFIASPASLSPSPSPSPSASLASSASGLPSALDPRVPVAIRYICLPSVRMLRYAGSAHALGFPTLRALTAAFKRDVPTSSSSSPSSTVSPDPSGPTGAAPAFDVAFGSSVPLTPLFFWHDKTHIASRTHYLRRVFPTRLALGRGDFIEDHIGQRARDQMKRDPAAWHRWACWLYYPERGNQLCLRHLQGRTWRGEEQEQAIRDKHVERNRSAASAAAAMAVAAAAARKKEEKKGEGAEQNQKQRRRSSAARHEMGWAAMPFEASDGE